MLQLKAHKFASFNKTPDARHTRARTAGRFQGLNVINFIGVVFASSAW